MGAQKLVLASGNAGKLREIGRLLAPLGYELLPQSALGIDGAEESGASFVDNALLKARHAARQSGLPALADDSGLAVTALAGAPGVRSARFAGDEASDADNVDKLLQELDALADAGREAVFHCVLALVGSADDPVPLIAEGRWPGRILRARRGSNGFGYDPVFFDPLAGKAAAEMSAEEKNRRSHRGQALRQLSAALARKRP